MPRSHQRRKVTLSDIAARLLLDKSSISLALRGSPKISPGTRKKVVKIARAWGYRPNLAARQLAGASPQIVTLVLPYSFAALSSAAAAATIRCLAAQAAHSGMIFNVLSCDNLIQALENRTAMPFEPDGVLIWGDVPAPAATTIRRYIRRAVVVDPLDPSYAAYQGAVASIDNASGSRSIVRHLIECGAENLLFVMNEDNHLGQKRRWKAARSVWTAQNSRSSLFFQRKEELTDSFLRNFARRRKAAIFCSNDRCAMETWHRLQRMGMRVPGQVLLAGFDGEEPGGLIGLTSAIFDGEALGRSAFQLLKSQSGFDASDSASCLIPVEIRVGRTTRAHIRKANAPGKRKTKG